MRKGVAGVHSTRLQRIKVKLLKYIHTVRYKSEKDLHIADLLSRNYLKETAEDDKFINEVVHSINMTAEKKEEFQQKCAKDMKIQKLSFN